MPLETLRKVFAAASIALLVVLAVSPFKDYYREWKRYQYRYNDVISQLPQRVPTAQIGIKQIWVQKLDRVDRCVTCHLGLTEEALRSAPEPFRTHPHIDHPVENLGCTICHEGQGAATEYKESIGLERFWDRPMVPREFMESSCGKCHKERDVPHASVLNLGRSLIRDYNCAACHKIGNEARLWVPPLDGIGAKVSRAWLVNWLKDPIAYSPSARMPNFLLSDDEVNTLADYLMTFTTPPAGVLLDSLPPPLLSKADLQNSKLAEAGATTFREARCISCHPIGGKGGYVAIDLGKVASKDSKVWLYNFIREPKRLLPGVVMPRYRFTGEQLAGVVAYVEGEFVDYDMVQPPPHVPAPDYYEKGRMLFRKYNCGGCHALGNISRPEEMGPELTTIGSKNIYEIEFGSSGIAQTLPAYLSAKLKTPRIFSPAMKMPRFPFSDEQIRAVTTALLANTAERIPQEFIVPATPPSTYAPQGEFGKLVDDLACFGCHTINGRGRLVATDLSLEGSQARENWIQGYFKVPYSLRPILTERMPNLFLHDDEIKTLTGYIETVLIADSIGKVIRMDASTVAEGRGLYFQRYSCQACHQLNNKGGYVGPPLDKVGDRLSPGWTFHWLKNPQAFKPQSIEPNNRLTDEEAEALTAFLMTLK